MLDAVQLGHINQNTARHQMDGLYQFKMHANTNTPPSKKRAGVWVTQSASLAWMEH